MINRIQSFDLKILLSLNHFFSRHGFSFLNKFFAEYLTYTLPLILIILWFWSGQAKKVSLRALFSAILAWPVFATIIGHFVNRPRPFESGGVQELVFHRPTFSFPSDHAAALFAVAFSLWFSGYKKLSGLMFVIAVVVSFFRVTTGIHWPTDILAGLVIGFVAAYLIDLFDKPLSIVYGLIIKGASYLRLA